MSEVLHTLIIEGVSNDELSMLAATCIGLKRNAEKCQKNFVPGSWEHQISISEKILKQIRSNASEESCKQLDDLELAISITDDQNPDLMNDAIDKSLQAGIELSENLEMIKNMGDELNNLTNHHG